jgi:hypothetical protein
LIREAQSEGYGTGRRKKSSTRYIKGKIRENNNSLGSGTVKDECGKGTLGTFSLNQRSSIGGLRYLKNGKKSSAGYINGKIKEYNNSPGLRKADTVPITQSGIRISYMSVGK